MGRRSPPVGWIRFGNLRRLDPVSRRFGYDRGQPVDRHYIEGFLARHAADVRGRVVEVGDDAYTRRFGGERVERADILHVSPANPRATIVADLASADHVPSDTFDCVIVTQTLHLIYDVAAAVRTIHRVLRPGGVCLATVPGISQVDEGEWQDSWYWSMTPVAVRRLFGEAFPGGDVAVEGHGNVLASCAFLQGLGSSELSRRELEHHDPSFPLVVAARAVKAPAADPAR
ncbi:MAG TPA: methyltransferase domain-containing protein [Gemmatimonadales bacterium]